MKRVLWISGLLLLASFALPASAQLLPAHAPTAVTPARPAPAAQPDPALQVTGKAVARVNGAVLTDRDLLREMFAIFPYARLHNGFPRAMEPQIRQGALQMIIFEELVYQEAERRKMTVPAARLNRAESDFRRQFATPEEFNAYLKTEMHGSRQELRREIRRSLLIEAMLKREVQDKCTVSVTEAKAYYDKNPAQFSHPETFAIQTISIVPPQKATPEVLQAARKRAEDDLRQAKATRSYQEFGLLAEKISEDDYRVNMGDHHDVARSDLPPEILKALLAMKPGQVSDLIPVGNFFAIVRLNAHDAAGKVSFDSVKGRLQTDLKKSKYNDLRTDLGRRLRKNAKIEEL